tara:strand:+ start:9470 stop:9718 length:249 start_codon:yes stop_codon:yes gene_type:complete
MMMPPQQGGMPPQPMPQEQMMPQQAPPDPAQMHAAVVARLEEIEIEKAELIGILQQMEGGGAPQQMAAAPPMGPPMEPGLLG